MALSIPNDIIPTPDLEQVRRALDVLVPPGSTFEVRGLPSRRSYVGRDIDAAVNAIRGMAADQGIYWTLNPLRPDQSKAASDRDVMHRARLMVDVDPVRPKEDGCATDPERREAQQVANEIYRDLGERSWPDPVVIDTGNGVQLIYAIDLPNNEQSRLWVRGVLEKLTATYSTDHAKVDTSVHNASRISRVPGTWNRKGTNSPARPHRISQVVRWPASFDVVGAELIQDFVGATQAASVPAVNGTPNLLIPIALPENGEAAWYRKALENECAKVVLAANGTRHERLIDAAITLAGYLHFGAFTENDLRQTLATAAERAGLPQDESSKAIEWGVVKGKANPLDRPTKLALSASTRARELVAAQSGTIPDDAPITVVASSIVPTRVQWLWPNRVPKGKLTTFAGWGGLGKSFVTLDMAARISVGAEWPFCGGECAEPGNVLVMNTEDDPSDTTVPRLMESEPGADLDRIRFLVPQRLNVFTLDDITTLDRAFVEMGNVQLVIVDPATAHLGAANDHKNSELRAVLMPLALWAMERRVAVCLVTHVNKPQGAKVEAMARVVGGVAWVNAVRSALMFSKDPEDNARRLMVGMKNNLGPEEKGLSYRIVPTNGLARVEWLGTVETNADDAINGEKKQKRADRIKPWLVERFREALRWPSDQLKQAAKEHGYSFNAFREACDEMGIRAERARMEDGRDAWFKFVPPDWVHFNANDGGQDAAF
jgi:hypothetical protein